VKLYLRFYVFFQNPKIWLFTLFLSCCTRFLEHCPREMGTAAPSFRGMSILWPRSPISATAELLFCCLPVTRSRAISSVSFIYLSINRTLRCYSVRKLKSIQRRQAYRVECLMMETVAVLIFDLSKARKLCKIGGNLVLITRWPWMTLNGVMALILRYFTEFGSFRGAQRKSG